MYFAFFLDGTYYCNNTSGLQNIRFAYSVTDRGTEYDGYCYISHSEADEEVEALKEILMKHFPNIKGGIKVFNIGTVIGSHTGPGTVALFFMGKDKEG